MSQGDIVGIAKYNLIIDIFTQEQILGDYLKAPSFREEWNKHSAKWDTLTPAFCHWVIVTTLHNMRYASPTDTLEELNICDLAAIDWIKENT